MSPPSWVWQRRLLFYSLPLYMVWDEATTQAAPLTLAALTDCVCDNDWEHRGSDCADLRSIAHREPIYVVLVVHGNDIGFQSTCHWRGRYGKVDGRPIIRINANPKKGQKPPATVKRGLSSLQTGRLPRYTSTVLIRFSRSVYSCSFCRSSKAHVSNLGMVTNMVMDFYRRLMSSG